MGTWLNSDQWKSVQNFCFHYEGKEDTYSLMEQVGSMSNLYSHNSILE
jgi:hypothetical protein